MPRVSATNGVPKLTENDSSTPAPPTIVRKCSGPETAFNNISNNGGATIGCVTSINVATPISCAEFNSLFELLYNKYEILRLRFVFQNKVLYWREASREETFNVHQGGVVRDQSAFTKEFFTNNLCELYPHGSNLWYITLCPFVREGEETPTTSEDTDENKGGECEGVVKYSSFLVGFRCNHGFLDGVGVMSLFQDFGNIASEFVSTQTMPIIEPVALSAPYEELVPEAKFVWLLRQFASVGIKFVETFASLRKSLPNYYPVQNMLRLEKFKPRGWTTERESVHDVTGVGYQYFVLHQSQLELFQKFRKEHKLSFSGLLMSLLSIGMMKYAFKGFEWPTKLLAFDCLRDTRMYFKDSYSNRTKYVTNYIGATMPVLFLAAAFNEKRCFKGDKSSKKQRRKSHENADATTPTACSSNTSFAASGVSNRLADCLIEYSKSQSRVITNIIRKRSASMVTLKSVAYYLQAFADPDKARRLFSLIRTKDSTEGRSAFAGFSNLGRVDADPKHVDIKSLVAAIDISRFIYCINYIVVTVRNDVHITMSYPNALYNDESMSELISAIQEVINIILDRYKATISPPSTNVDVTTCASSADVTATNDVDISSDKAPGGSKPQSAQHQIKPQCSSKDGAAEKSWDKKVHPMPVSDTTNSSNFSGKVVADDRGSASTDVDICAIPVDDSDDIGIVNA